MAGLYPSLQLNLSECYRKLGDLARAREHLHPAQAAIGVLGRDEYGRLIRYGLAQMTERLHRGASTRICGVPLQQLTAAPAGVLERPTPGRRARGCRNHAP